MSQSAQALLLDLLSTVRGPTPVRVLIEATQLFGFTDNNTRVALNKLCREGRVERKGHGIYRLAAAEAGIGTNDWRKLETRHRSWRGDWAALHLPETGSGPFEIGLDRALRVLGLRELSPGLYLRPDNLRGGIEDLRTRFERLAPKAEGLLFVIRDLAEDQELRARGLWPTDQLQRRYRKRCGDLVRSRKRVARLEEKQALVEFFALGARVVRELITDPLLPSEILDPSFRLALLEAMRDYDREGRRRWREFSNTLRGASRS